MHLTKFSINWLFFFVLSTHFSFFFSQNQHQNIVLVDTIYKDSVPIKILYDNKIYKLNAGFASIGTGYYLANTINASLNAIGITFNFHTFKNLFVQCGFNRIKGDAAFNYPDKKNINVSYFNFILSPVALKTETTHFAFVFVPLGMTYGGGYKDETYHYKGILTTDSTNTVQNNYFGMNAYCAVHCYYKFKYDLGIGADAYAEFNPNNFVMIGLKIGFYFSAAFKGYQTKPAWYYKKNPDKN